MTPIEGLDGLPEGKQVIVVQGTLSRAALSKATGRLVVSWDGDPRAVNWAEMGGRSAVVWPTGGNGDQIAALLADHGCAVKVLHISDPAWDAVAAVAAGWGQREIDTFMKETARAWEPPIDVEAEIEPIPTPPDLDSMPAWMDEAPPHEPDYLAWADEGFMEPKEVAEIRREARMDVPKEGRTVGGSFKIWGGDEDAMREWAFLYSDGVFENVHTGARMGKTAFDLTMVPDTPIVECENSKGETVNKRLPPSKCWAEYLDPLIVSGSMYRPDVPAISFSKDGVKYLNAYKPGFIPAADPDWKQHDAWQIVNDHFHNVIPDGADLVLDWWAHNVQHPGKKILWSPVIVGVQGDGKTTLAKVGQIVMGVANVKVVSPEAVNSEFTDWGEGAAVRVLEEIKVDGQSRAHVMEKLKPFITNEVVDVVPKGGKGRNIVNVTNYFALSNHINALMIDENDRRWGVWKTRFTSSQHMRSEMNGAYWKRLHDAINQHADVLRGWLMARDLSKFDRFDPPPLNEAKMMMVEASRTPIMGDIIEALSLGGLGVADEVLATDCLNDLVKGVGGRTVNTTTMANALQGLGWAKFDRTLKWRGKSRRVYFRAAEFEGVDPGVLADKFRRILDDTDTSNERLSDW